MAMDFSSIEYRVLKMHERGIESLEKAVERHMSTPPATKTWNMEWFRFEAHKVLPDIDYVFWCPDRDPKLVVGRVIEMAGRKACVFADDAARDGAPDVLKPVYYARVGPEPFIP